MGSGGLSVDRNISFGLSIQKQPPVIHQKIKYCKLHYPSTDDSLITKATYHQMDFTMAFCKNWFAPIQIVCDLHVAQGELTSPIPTAVTLLQEPGKCYVYHRESLLV